MAHIPVDQIREVGWGVYEKGNLIVSDLSMIGHKWAFDSAEKQREWDKSGLFFRLKSVEHPELQVKMGAETTIRKWMEIWNQMMEGAPATTKKVPVAPAEAI